MQPDSRSWNESTNNPFGGPQRETLLPVCLTAEHLYFEG